MGVHTTFVSRLSSILTDNKQDRYLTRKRTGTLDTHRLSRIAFSSKLFKKRQERQGKNYNVSLLIDVSGSMSANGRLGPAHQAAVQLSLALGAIGINHEIAAFNMGDYLLRPFTTKPVSIKEQSELFADIMGIGGRGSTKLPTHTWVDDDEVLYVANDADEIRLKYGVRTPLYFHQPVPGGNNDGKAVHDAVTRLTSLGKGRNILIVLSDGEPAPSRFKCADRKDRRTYDSFELSHEIRIANRKNVTVCGIGIENHGVESFYPAGCHAVVENLPQLYRGITKMLSRHIPRGV